MNADIYMFRPVRGPQQNREVLAATRCPGAAFPVSVPSTPLLAHALPSLTWSDAYAVCLPIGWQKHDPQEWADAIFHKPPWWVRILFEVRNVVVRAVGIEPGDTHVFDTLDWRPDEVLLGTDQRHLDFRASVLVEPGRVVVSTVVKAHNLRGRAYSGLVRPIHSWVVRGTLTRAIRRMSEATS
jgi:hypothetical protein